MLWNQTWGGIYNDIPYSVIQTSDGGYAIAGYTKGVDGVNWDEAWLVKTDSAGIMVWNQTYGGASTEWAFSVIQTPDGGYLTAGRTLSFGAGNGDFWLVRTDSSGNWLGDEPGVSLAEFANNTITLYRGVTDPYWNFVRVRIWTIEEPTWQYGDINQDGVVDATDLFILSQNYGKTFSLLSLTGIIAVAGIHQYKKPKKPK